MAAATLGDRGTTINRVRLRGASGLDPLSARLRAGHAIEQVADCVALPAASILCVRRLRDPQPGRVGLAGWHSPPPEWARAVAETLAGLARRAARPADGVVAADAEAVIFDDRAQMLACLAADWCRGSIAANWWWRALVGGSRDAEAVLRAWRQQPAYVAAAIEEAARFGFATPFVRRLAERDTAVLLEAMVDSHGLPRRLLATDRFDAHTVHAGEGASMIALRAVGAARPADSAVPPPWRDLVPEALASGLRVDQQLLLGVALTVRRDAARARDPIFAPDVVRWRAGLDAIVNAPAARVADAAPASDPASAWPESATNAVPSESPPLGAAPAAVHAQGGEPNLRDERQEPEWERHGSPSTMSHETRANGAIAADDIHGEHGAPLPCPRIASVAVETELGGLFYLLNLALALGLYGDFTAPLHPRLDLSIWRFIALVGGALLRGRRRRDPVWPLLAELAGPETSPARGIAEWRLDPAWLTAFPETRTWRWSADADRVRVRHPAGFDVLDIERSAGRSAADQVRDEIDRYRPLRSIRVVHRPRMGETKKRQTKAATDAVLKRWTRWQARYARARLARALGVPRGRAGELLCRHRARVSLSLTHVDVAFSLADLPIAIRLSGLDRDPGWIPAADRIVSFRYE